MEKGGWERGDQPPRTEVTEDKRRERERDRKERWEVGRAPLKGNLVNEHRWCS